MSKQGDLSYFVFSGREATTTIAMSTACDAPTSAKNKENVAIEMTDATKTKHTESIPQKAGNGHDNGSNCSNPNNNAPRDKNTTNGVPMVDISDTNTRGHCTLASVDAADDSDAHNEDALTDDGADESDDKALVHTMLREAAADTEQPSLDDWHLVVRGFNGKAVEDAYQAGQASGRMLGVTVSSLFYLMAGIVVLMGDGTTASTMLGLNFPLFTSTGIIILVPLTIKMLQAGKPVKHRSLVYLTCCALATLGFLQMLVALLWVIGQGHAVSRPDIMVWTYMAVMCPIPQLMMLRPSAWLTSATCTTSATLVGVMGYYSNTFNSPAVSIAAGILYNVAVHTMWFIFENTIRISFVHQLNAMRHAEAGAPRRGCRAPRRGCRAPRRGCQAPIRGGSQK